MLWQPSATDNMATMMAPVSAVEVQPQAAPFAEHEASQREVLRCDHCKLVQFRTTADTCRRCKKSLLPEIPKVQPAISLVPEPVTKPSSARARSSGMNRVDHHAQRRCKP